jgi:hypothetical protein
MKKTADERNPSPLRGEGKGGGERPLGMVFLPLTLTLSLKGRGDISLDKTHKKKGG